eukprot:gene19412-19871_t
MNVSTPAVAFGKVPALHRLVRSRGSLSAIETAILQPLPLCHVGAPQHRRTANTIVVVSSEVEDLEMAFAKAEVKSMQDSNTTLDAGSIALLTTSGGRGAGTPPSVGLKWMGQTALHCSVDASYTAAAALLLKFKAEPDTIDAGGWTGLHYAARRGTTRNNEPSPFSRVLASKLGKKREGMELLRAAGI